MTIRGWAVVSSGLVLLAGAMAWWCEKLDDRTKPAPDLGQR
jgi:hypothetical protein